MNETKTPLSPGLSPVFSSMGLALGRVTGSVVGRSQELTAIEQELKSPRGGLVCLTAEGEPGIGKTRLLRAIEEMARGLGFLPIAVTADEEIRGPFLVARSIFASPNAIEAAEATPAEQPMQRAMDALSNQDDPGLESMAPNQKLLRVFDLAAVAVRALAKERPIALLIDDVQWADEDSLRMLRYIVRADAADRILLVVAVRPDEVALVNEAVTLLADMERMAPMRRLKLHRFSQLESTEFLQQVLGGRIHLASAATMHAQAEGVPFILEEQAHAYREAGLIQQIDGVWTLASNAERLLPSAVRTLIQRRAARLPEDTKSAMTEAAILGHSFSLRDLREVKIRLGDDGHEAESLADTLAEAVAAGLLIQHSVGSAADYSFSHDRIRDYLTAQLTPPRRRAIHAAIVDMLGAGGDSEPACLQLLAQHALAAGQSDLAARAAIEAADNAVRMHAPEEALRLVDLAHPVASTPQDRVRLLRLRDDALDMLRHSTQRLEGLAELSALAEALRDSHLELEVMLRRSAALRLSQEHDRAADLTHRVRELAVERGDSNAELAACLELGQALLRTELGEGYVQAPSEADIDGAGEAFERAAVLAEEVGDDPRLAAAVRELGIIGISRVRAWVVARTQAGEHVQLLWRIAAGERLEDILPTLPIAPVAEAAFAHLRRALEIFERIGDRQGVMSTIIAIAYLSWGPEVHLGGSAKRIEEMRRLATRMKSFTKESERQLAEAQMLFGAQVYAQAKVFPDVALEKGTESYAAARAIGDHSIEFASAGGMALTCAELGAAEEAERWLGRAAAVASVEPTPLRARKIESWRGLVMAAAGDVDGMREHLERAVKLATEQGRPAARCEALAMLAREAARMGADRQDEALLALAETSATEAKGLMPVLPGHPLWGAQADAALARVYLTRGSFDEAANAGRDALAALDAAMTEDFYLDILLPSAEAVLKSSGETEAAAVRDRVRLTLALLAQHILDEDVRVRWFRTPAARELTRLAGPLEAPEGKARPEADGAALVNAETGLLRLLTEGRTNREIAEELDTTEAVVSRQLGELFVKIGASSRADATFVALINGLV
jgi:DNA-binding NarL/FixJ family response regulator/tetratricopeptide (TPR) repeat protein